MKLNITKNPKKKLEDLKNILKIENVFMETITVTQQSSDRSPVKVLLKDGTMQEINDFTLEQVYAYIKTNGKKIDINEKIYRYGINIEYSEVDTGHASISYNNGVDGPHNQFTNSLHYYPDPKNLQDDIKTSYGTVPAKTIISKELPRTSLSHIETTLFAINNLQQKKLINFINNAKNNPQVYHAVDMNCLQNQQALFTAIDFRGNILDYITVNNNLPTNLIGLSQYLNNRENPIQSPLLNFFTNTDIKNPLNILDGCHAKSSTIDLNSGSVCYEKKQLARRDDLNTRNQIPVLPLATTTGINYFKSAFDYPSDSKRDTSHDKIPQHIGEPLSLAIGCFSSCYYFSQGLIPALMYIGVENMLKTQSAANKSVSRLNKVSSNVLKAAMLLPGCSLNPLYSILTTGGMLLGGKCGQYFGKKTNVWLYPKNINSNDNKSPNKIITKQPKDTFDDTDSFGECEAVDSNQDTIHRRRNIFQNKDCVGHKKINNVTFFN
jgi:hypothetical protein